MKQSILLPHAGACLAAMLLAFGSQAGETHSHRPQTSHVHGSAALNLVTDGAAIHIELISPAANLVGFEHAPVSEAEHAAHKNALSTLEKSGGLFRFNKTAGCRTEHVEIVSESTPAVQPQGHEAHRHHAADDDEHADKGHSDITAIYRFTCDAPGKLETLHIGLFDAFPALENLSVQYITDGRQGAATLNGGESELAF
jgi:hypothetical protein